MENGGRSEKKGEGAKSDTYFAWLIWRNLKYQKNKNSSG
jgi:hypothetical protein